MDKEQRSALANLNGWLMVTVITAVIGVSLAKWLLFAVIPCMLVASYYQNKFIGEQ